MSRENERPTALNPPMQEQLKSLEAPAMTRCLLRGAAWGTVAWVVYGGVEIMLATGVQLWRDPEREILRWQWPLIGMLMGAYAAIGMAAGAAGCLALRRRMRDPQAPRIFAVWTVTMAFAANLVLGMASGSHEVLALAVALLLAAALAAALVSQRQRKRFQFLLSPWSVSLLLLGAPWISHQATGQVVSPVRTVLALGLLASVAAVAALANHLRSERAPAMRGQAVAVAVVFAAFVLAALAHARGSTATPEANVRGAAPPGAPNVLLVVMDTVRADHTSLYGYERDTTPYLRALAGEATLYTRSVATSDFTLPTHASMFTGMYRDWHGAFRPEGKGPQPLRPDRTTLAQMLSARGYWTAGAVANFAYLASWSGLMAGFATTETAKAVVLPPIYPFYLGRVAKRLLRPVLDVTALDRHTMTAADMEPRSLTLLKRAKARGRPFFLFVNYMDAHFPYLPDAPFDRRFPGKGATSISLGDRKREVTLRERPLSAAEQRHLISQYDGAIAEEDASIGRLIDRLRESGWYDNTLIVVTADHGEAFGEHDLLQHDLGFAYQNLVGVPLLIKYPRQRAARRVDELTSQVDLMPTVLDAAGIPPPPGLQGISLLAPEVGRDRAIYSAASGPLEFARVNPRFQGTRHAIFAGSLKLITSTNGPPELYDLATDSKEEHNLYSAEDPRAADLSRRLDDWARSTPAQNSRPYQLDPATRERLKSLGYVQ